MLGYLEFFKFLSFGLIISAIIIKSLKGEFVMSNQTPHAPGKGSDKEHPETPSDANERFRKENEKKK